MMSKPNASTRVIILLALGLFAFACTVPNNGYEELKENDDFKRTDIELLGGNNDIPSWLKILSVNLKCGESLEQTFVEQNSAHLYSFIAQGKTAHDFILKGQFPQDAGIVIALYDQETGEQLAIARNNNDNQVTLQYTPQQEVKLFVAIYTISISTTGSYTLSVQCEKSGCHNNNDCSKSDFCYFETGCGKTASGICKPRPDISTVKLAYLPVCGCDGNTYGHKMLAFAAGVSVEHQGECKELGAKCQAQGGYCTHFQTTCKDNYIDGPPSDCPMGRSGKCCLPGVTLTTDKQAYRVKETIVVKVNNGIAESIFLPGCPGFSWEKLHNDAWVNLGPDIVCVWEGYAKEVKTGGISSGQLAVNEVGTYRLTTTYSIGCQTDKPLSQANCKNSKIIHSKPFIIKECPQLTPPGPQFCPDGKIVPRYDDLGICITGYQCQSNDCDPKECGPQLGMPNYLCPDGESVAGPTGNCLRSADGTCGWDIKSCPEA